MGISDFYVLPNNSGEVPVPLANAIRCSNRDILEENLNADGRILRAAINRQIRRREKYKRYMEEYLNAANDDNGDFY